MGKTIQQRDIGARFNRQMHVRHLRKHGHSRIDHDHRELALLQCFTQSPENNRMLFGKVGANRQQALGMFKILITTGRTIRTKRALIAGHRRGHAQGGVAIIIIGADHPARQFAQRIKLFRHDLTGGYNRKGIAPMLGLNIFYRPGYFIQRRIPARFFKGFKTLIPY